MQGGWIWWASSSQWESSACDLWYCCSLFQPHWRFLQRGWESSVSWRMSHCVCTPPSRQNNSEPPKQIRDDETIWGGEDQFPQIDPLVDKDSSDMRHSSLQQTYFPVHPTNLFSSEKVLWSQRLCSRATIFTRTSTEICSCHTETKSGEGDHFQAAQQKKTQEAEPQQLFQSPLLIWKGIMWWQAKRVKAVEDFYEIPGNIHFCWFCLSWMTGWKARCSCFSYNQSYIFKGMKSSAYSQRLVWWMLSTCTRSAVTFRGLATLTNLTQYLNWRLGKFVGPCVGWSISTTVQSRTPFCFWPKSCSVVEWAQIDKIDHFLF